MSVVCRPNRRAVWSTQEEYVNYQNTSEAVAEARDAALLRALEANAALREQLTNAESHREVFPLDLGSSVL